MESQTQAPPTQAQPSGVGIKIQAWLVVNKKLAAWMAGAVAVLVVALVAFFQHQAGRETAASQAVSEVRIPYNPAHAPEPGAAEKLFQIANEYKGTKAAASALLLSGGLLYSEKDFAKAQD